MAQHLLLQKGYEVDEELSINDFRIVLKDLKTFEPIVIINYDKISYWDFFTKSDATLKKRDEKFINIVSRKYNDSKNVIVKYIHKQMESSISRINIFLGTDKIPNYLNQVLHSFGDNLILSITCCRKPFDKSTVKSIDLISFGDLSYKQNKHNFKANHTFFIIKFIDQTIIKLEKSPEIPIHIEENPKIPSTTSFMLVDKIPILTLNQLIINTKNYMKEKFNSYNFINNNCQDFCLAVLKANSIDDPSRKYYKFFYQNISKYTTISEDIQFGVLGEGLDAINMIKDRI
jgi:hypothetical protein